jgi:hypothetical protein
MGSQSWDSHDFGSPNFGNFGTPTWESQDKMPFGCWSCDESQSILYKGEGGGFPQARAMVILVSSSLPMACPSTKSAPTMQ